MPPKLPDWITVPEAARLLRRSRFTVYRHIRSGAWDGFVTRCGHLLVSKRALACARGCAMSDPVLAERRSPSTHPDPEIDVEQTFIVEGLSIPPWTTCAFVRALPVLVASSMLKARDVKTK